jgi:hypothetical protein
MVHAAVRTRHHIECLCSYIATLLLVLLIKRHQQQCSSSGADPQAPQQLLTEVVSKIPAPLQTLLQVLGCRSATLAQAMQLSNDSPAWHCIEGSAYKAFELQLCGMVAGLYNLCRHSKAYLSSNPANLPVLELQQHVQLHLLLPSVLLDWVAGKPSSDSNYSDCCMCALQAANMSSAVLRCGPATLRQHMDAISQPEPQSPALVPLQPASFEENMVVRIPAEFYARQVQLLGELLPNLQQLWDKSLTQEPLSAASSAPGATASGSSSSRSSNRNSGRVSVTAAAAGHGELGFASLVHAVSFAGSFAIALSRSPPALSIDPAESSVSLAFMRQRAVSSAAGELCAILESVVRMELAAQKQAAAKTALGVAYSQIDVQPAIHSQIGSPCLISAGQPGSLVDPILKDYRTVDPSCKACKQLCSLLTTLLKACAWDSSQVPADSALAQRAITTCGMVCWVALVFVGRIPVGLNQGLPVERLQEPVAGDNTGSQGAASMLPWLALLGRCCLQLQPPHLGQLKEAVAISKGWLSAGSHTAEVAALGFDVEGLLQQLGSAAALLAASSAVSSAQLQQPVAMALANFAHPFACNNPLCRSVEGPSEATLVQGSSNSCRGCRVARYCGRECQQAHWKQHKPVYKRLAAGASAAAAAAAAPGGA